jgi:hypothetical protein
MRASAALIASAVFRAGMRRTVSDALRRGQQLALN